MMVISIFIFLVITYILSERYKLLTQFDRKHKNHSIQFELVLKQPRDFRSENESKNNNYHKTVIVHLDLHSMCIYI